MHHRRLLQQSDTVDQNFGETNQTKLKIRGAYVFIDEQQVKTEEFSTFVYVPRLPKTQQTHLRGIRASAGSEIS